MANVQDTGEPFFISGFLLDKVKVDSKNLSVKKLTIIWCT